MSNSVNHPPHYNASKFEVWDVLDEWFPTRPLLWNVVKYLARAGKKGDEVEDLKKARVYLERQIEKLEQQRKPEARISIDAKGLQDALANAGDLIEAVSERIK